MNAIVLMVFLLLFLTSIFVHADHLVAQGQTTEQQGCQLCNQGIDTPPELSTIEAVVVTRYNFFTAQITTAEFTLSQFIQPLLRAPPFIQ
ncbi:MAG TPA: hypothetical protein DE042_08090 [Colwellia sp.]|nr:hypothetical protein [Colwellia sp.]